MKLKTIIIFMLVVLLLAACQTATPVSTPVPVEPSATEGIPAAPTATVTEEPTAISALDIFLLTKAAVTPAPTYNVDVEAKACWMKSDINVVTGQRVSISAKGIVNTYKGSPGGDSDPNGQAANMCGGTKCPVIGVGYGSLIGRVGDGKAFFVGSAYEFIADRDGPLYFTVNDWECDDNNGTFNLVIRID